VAAELRAGYGRNELGPRVYVFIGADTISPAAVDTAATRKAGGTDEDKVFRNVQTRPTGATPPSS